LQAVNTVILDATFRRRGDRQEAMALAGRMGARFLAVQCLVSRGTVLERIVKRSNEDYQKELGEG
jgi:predicted kinase